MMAVATAATTDGGLASDIIRDISCDIVQLIAFGVAVGSPRFKRSYVEFPHFCGLFDFGCCGNRRCGVFDHIDR